MSELTEKQWTGTPRGQAVDPIEPHGRAIVAPTLRQLNRTSGFRTTGPSCTGLIVERSRELRFSCTGARGSDILADTADVHFESRQLDRRWTDCAASGRPRSSKRAVMPEKPWSGDNGAFPPICATKPGIVAHIRGNAPLSLPLQRSVPALDAELVADVGDNRRPPVLSVIGDKPDSAAVLWWCGHCARVSPVCLVGYLHVTFLVLVVSSGDAER